jgi:amidohydrolase
MSRLETLLNEARELAPRVIELRRALHAEPELGLSLPATQARIVARLRELGLAPELGAHLSSVVARIDGARPGPVRLIRADMDALPMEEDTGLPFASRRPGAMHACGHDAHVAMALGAVELCVRHRAELTGSVVFMFQPGEEGHEGARIMLEEGLLDRHPAERALAIHVFSTIPAGVVATRSGAIMASADEFELRLLGKGGHASAPHEARDPIPAAAEIVLALQSAMTRSIDVFDPAVLTVAQLSAGSTFNVIPEEAVIRGTWRAISDRTRDRVRERIDTVARQVAHAHGLGIEVTWPMHGYPVTVNDEAEADRVLALASRLVGAERVVRLEHPIMGAEDFSYVLAQVPGAMVFLGVAPPGVEDPHANHSNRMVVDEDALAVGVALEAAWALEGQ